LTETKEVLYCKKCNRTLNAGEFYGTNNLEKYPKGKVDTCKKCMTMLVDNWDPNTYLWIL
jgi:methionyl-tRNA synthetase